MLGNKGMRTRGLDKDLERLNFVGDAAEAMGRRLGGAGLALAFLTMCAVVAAFKVGSADFSDVMILVAASAFGGYMAMNIGANDVANNVGPAVGARAVSLTGALVIAAICESAGAFLAGGEVVGTVSSEIFSLNDVPDSFSYVQAMLTAMVAAALWINFATYVGAPVSTTHSIVGGIIGAGIAASSFDAIDWTTFSAIAATWVLSPILGGIAAAVLMAFINSRIIYCKNKLKAARFWLPVLLGVLGGVFSAYVLLKATDHASALPDWLALSLSLVLGSGIWWGYSRHIVARLHDMENSESTLRELFSVPLMVTAAMLSFAHGANDVANAIGPLAAIVHSQSQDVHDMSFLFGGVDHVDIPHWVIAVGAFGISAGLLLFGRRLVTVVGKQITKLNPVRAFCITLATAATVLTASSLGLPVSTTHIAVGAVFGIGFYREWHRNRYVSQGGQLRKRNFLRNREERRRRLLVRRTALFSIIAAWIVTVPASALLAAALFNALGYFWS